MQLIASIATGSCRAQKEPTRAWQVISTITYIFTADFDYLVSIPQSLPRLSPGMPWPAAAYDCIAV